MLICWNAEGVHGQGKVGNPCVKESESGIGVGNFGKPQSENLERSESGILPPTTQPWLKATLDLEAPSLSLLANPALTIYHTWASASHKTCQ